MKQKQNKTKQNKTKQNKTKQSLIDEFSLEEIPEDEEDVLLVQERLSKVPSDVEKFTKVKSLNLRQNYIKKIEHINKLVTLLELDMYDNLVGKIENIDALQNLKFVFLLFLFFFF